MALMVNQILVRTMDCRAAYDAHPELHGFMQPWLSEALIGLSNRAGPLLRQSAHQAQALDDIERVYEKSHDLLKQLHFGLRYNYHQHPAGLDKLGALVLGKEPEQDRIKLVNLAHQLPTLTPKFVWLADLTLADVKRAIDAHVGARAKEELLGHPARKALEALRELREPAQALWDDGLDAWIMANIRGHEDQITWGRERRRRPRTGRSTPDDTTETPPAATG